MREILFRGKRIDNGEWVYGYYDVFRYCEDAPLIYLIHTNGWTNSVEIEPGTVGQYTGMTDKNDKKIFEGDIIECKVFGAMATDKHKKYIVVFDNGTYFAQWSIGEHKFSAYMNETWDRNVVGNKWDNPELLEVNK